MPPARPRAGCIIEAPPDFRISANSIFVVNLSPVAIGILKAFCTFPNSDKLSGGIWETKKTSAIAEVFNAQVAPHLYAGPIEWAANIQLSASIPNLLIAETIETPFHKSLINRKINVEDGYIQVPEEAGLGIEVNEKLAEENPYNGADLHLMMQDDPCDYSNGNSFSGGAPPLKSN